MTLQGVSATVLGHRYLPPPTLPHGADDIADLLESDDRPCDAVD